MGLQPQSNVLIKQAAMNNKQTYTIQEISKLSGLPSSTLRYYESVGIIPPVKRGESSKQRIYDEDDLEIIVTVACLSATGMSIEAMKAYLKSARKEGNSTKIQIELLKNQDKHLVEEAAALKVKQQYVKVKIAYWQAIDEGDSKKIEATKNKAIKVAKELKYISDKENSK